MGARRVRLVAGGVVIGLTAAAAVGVVRVVRRRRRRVLSRRVRRAMTELLRLRGEGAVESGDVREKLLRRLVGELDERQLLALFALVEVGHFAKSTGVNPRNPSREQLARAVREYAAAELRAPATREALLAALELRPPEGLLELLAGGVGVLSRA